MNFTMDITTAATVLASLASVLGFFWTIIHNHQNKKDDTNDSSEDSPCVAVITHEQEDIDKLGQKLEDLEKVIGGYGVELEKLTALAAIASDENVRIRQDFLDNLDRIENRLEKMIDLILRLKHDE